MTSTTATDTTGPPCYSKCLAFLRERFDQTGIDMAIGLCPAVFVSHPEFPPITVYCPHRVRWLAEPTGDQRARWIADGAP